MLGLSDESPAAPCETPAVAVPSSALCAPARRRMREAEVELLRAGEDPEVVADFIEQSTIEMHAWRLALVEVLQEVIMEQWAEARLLQPRVH